MKGFIVLMALCAGSLQIHASDGEKHRKMREYFSQQMEFCVCLSEDRNISPDGNLYIMGAHEAFKAASERYEDVYGTR